MLQFYEVTSLTKDFAHIQKGHKLKDISSGDIFERTFWTVTLRNMLVMKDIFQRTKGLRTFHLGDQKPGTIPQGHF